MTKAAVCYRRTPCTEFAVKLPIPAKVAQLVECPRCKNQVPLLVSVAGSQYLCVPCWKPTPGLSQRPDSIFVALSRLWWSLIGYE